MLLSTAYFPPIAWFALAASRENSHITLEASENYQKGSFRNRCAIGGANGTLLLSIPLLKGKHQQTPIREVAIAYQDRWQAQHWKTICSTYGNSPFFEYYEDHFKGFYTTKVEYLFDYNQQIISTLAKLLKLSIEINNATEYLAATAPPHAQDFRRATQPDFTASKPFSYYPQVFEDRHGFRENLSIFDLLCCMGPQSLYYLRENYVNMMVSP